MNHEGELGSRPGVEPLMDEPADDIQQSDTQTRRLLLELQVHQVELELQNEELRLSRAAVEEGLARFTELYDFAPVGYFTFLPDGTIREVNLPGARLLHADRAHVLQRTLAEFLAPERRGAFAAWLAGVFAGTAADSHITTLLGEGSLPGKGPFLGREKPRRAIEVEAKLSSSGDVARAIVVDITARIELEEQLRQSQKMDTIGQLAGGVAHDFNNILGAMLLNLDSLDDDLEMPESSRPTLTELRSLAKRASNLTRQLLQFSRRQALDQSSVDLNATLRRLLEMLRRVLGAKLVCLWSESDGPLEVVGDVAQIEQVVVNLCLNARDAMAGVGTLSLATARVEFDGTSGPENPRGREGLFACVSVSDTGCGMTRDVASRVFEPFFTTKEVGKGTGLGLSSALGVIERHDGWMTLESTRGHGTCFRFYLPLSPNAPQKWSSVPPPSEEEPLGGTILLVEDEKAVRAVCVRALAGLGYKVLSAPDATVAWEIWSEHASEIELLLSDMTMPGPMTGLDLARKIWVTTPHLRVIIMSGYSSEMLEDAPGGPGGPGGYAFLEKPFDSTALRRAVRRALTGAPRVAPA